MSATTSLAPPLRRLNARLGGALVLLIAGMAMLGLLWTPYNPLAIDMRGKLAAPSAAHWLGTDEFGRDILSRLLAGAWTSAWISLATVAFAVLVGTAIGLAAGYLRGWLDRVIGTFNDALLAFPGILLALGVMTVMGPGRLGIVLALSLAYAPIVVRVVRGTVLSVREREFVEASRLMGNGEFYTMLRHVLPNCVAPLTVLATSMVGWVLLSESVLSFLGLGVPPPAPTWGNMLATGRPHIAAAPWIAVFPGLCISLALLGINLLGDALRDRLDPRMRT